MCALLLHQTGLIFSRPEVTARLLSPLVEKKKLSEPILFLPDEELTNHTQGQALTQAIIQLFDYLFAHNLGGFFFSNLSWITILQIPVVILWVWDFWTWCHVTFPAVISDLVVYRHANSPLFQLMKWIRQRLMGRPTGQIIDADK